MFESYKKLMFTGMSYFAAESAGESESNESESIDINYLNEDTDIQQKLEDIHALFDHMEDDNWDWNKNSADKQKVIDMWLGENVDKLDDKARIDKQIIELAKTMQENDIAQADIIDSSVNLLDDIKHQIQDTVLWNEQYGTIAREAHGQNRGGTFKKEIDEDKFRSGLYNMGADTNKAKEDIIASALENKTEIELTEQQQAETELLAQQEIEQEQETQIVAELLAQQEAKATEATAWYEKQWATTEQIMQIQEAVGLEWDDLDGVMWPNTLQAIYTYQSENGLTDDGKVGNLTLASMDLWDKNKFYMDISEEDPQEMIAQEGISEREALLLSGLNTAMNEWIQNKNMQVMVDYIDNINDGDWQEYINNPEAIAHEKQMFEKFSDIDMSQLDESLHDSVNVMKSIHDSMEDNNVTKIEMKEMFIGIGKVLEWIPNASYEMFTAMMSNSIDSLPKILNKADVIDQLSNYTFDSIVEGKQVKIKKVVEQDNGNYEIILNTPAWDGFNDFRKKNIRLADIDLNNIDNAWLNDIKYQLENVYIGNDDVVAKAEVLNEKNSVKIAMNEIDLDNPNA